MSATRATKKVSRRTSGRSTAKPAPRRGDRSRGDASAAVPPRRASRRLGFQVGGRLLAEATEAAAFEGLDVHELALREIDADTRRALARRDAGRPAPASRFRPRLKRPLADQYVLAPSGGEDAGAPTTATSRIVLPHRLEPWLENVEAAAAHAGLPTTAFARESLMRAIARAHRRRAGGGAPREPSAALLARREGRRPWRPTAGREEAERRLPVVLSAHLVAEIERAALFDGQRPTAYMRRAIDAAMCDALADREAGGEPAPGTHKPIDTRELLELYAVEPVPADARGEPRNERKILSNMAAPDTWLQLLDEAAHHRGYLVRMNFVRRAVIDRVRATERRRRRGGKPRPLQPVNYRRSVRRDLEALERFEPRGTVSALTFGASRRPLSTPDA